MADKTVVVKIDYDTKEAVSNVKDLTSVVEGEKVAQAKMKDELDKGKISQTQYSAEVAKSKETQSKANTERRNTVKLLGSEKGSVNQLKAQIKQLTQERDKLNVNTEEGRKKSQQLNAEIGEMKTALKGAQTETGKSVGAFGQFRNSLSSLPGPMGGVVNGIGGMTKASLKFIATPIGAIIAALVFVVTQLVKAFKRSEDRMNKIKALTAQVSGVFKALQKALEPVVDFLIDNVVVAFEAVGKAVDSTIGFVQKGLRKLGFDKAADDVEKWNNKLEEGSKKAKQLAEAEAELTKQLRFAQKVQLDFQKLAEKQRQIRDDEARSIDERIAANEKLGRILQQQLKEELAIAAKQLEVANLRIDVEGDHTTALDERAEALTRISDIQERISGQESEQLVNINSLIRERNQLESEKIKQAEELEKSAMDTLDAEIAAMEEGFEVEKEIEEERKELTALSQEEILRQSDERIEAIMRERELHQLILDENFASLQQIITATAHMADKRVTIMSDAASRIATINFKEIKNFKDGFNTIGKAAKGLTGLITAGHEAEYNDLMTQKDAELALVGDNIEEREKIEAKYNRKLVNLKKRQAKEEKKKAIIDASIATALAVVNGLTSKPFVPVGIAMGVLAGVLGGVQIAAIASKPLPTFTSDQVFAKGGVIGGKPHSMGGTKFFGEDGSMFEAEANEAMFVLSKDATAEIAALSMINESAGGKALSKGSSYLQEGGEVSPSSVEKTVDDAIQRTPIFVRVGDIETGMTEYNDTKSAGVI